MARVILQQSSQIKEVIRESYKPDTTFRVEGEAKTRVNLAFSQMPVECFLMEIHFIVESTEHLAALQWFRMRYIDGLDYALIAEIWGGRTKGQIENAVDVMLDDAVYRMPQWLANKCQDIYDTFLAAPKVPSKPRVKAGYKGLLERIGR